MQFVPERPTGHYEQYQTARVIMGPVGCNGQEQGWGAGSAVLHLPYIIATRFITRWFRAHWDCMLWGKSTFTPSHFQRRAPPFTCMYKWSSREIPVGKEGARSVVHLYRSVIVLLVLTFEETDRFSDRTGRLEHPPSLVLQMVLEGNPGRERGSPVGCSFVPVGYSTSCTDL